MSLNFTFEDLAEMPYREMQLLCKQHGAKANGKGDELRKRLIALLAGRGGHSAEATLEPSLALKETTNSPSEKPCTHTKPHQAEITRNYVGDESVLGQLRHSDFESKTQHDGNELRAETRHDYNEAHMAAAAAAAHPTPTEDTMLQPVAAGEDGDEEEAEEEEEEEEEEETPSPRPLAMVDTVRVHTTFDVDGNVLSQEAHVLVPKPKLASTPVATPGVDEAWEESETGVKQLEHAEAGQGGALDVVSPSVVEPLRWQGTHTYFEDSSDEDEGDPAATTGCCIEPVVEVTLACAMDTPTTVFVKASDLRRGAGAEKLSSAMRQMEL